MLKTDPALNTDIHSGGCGVMISNTLNYSLQWRHIGPVGVLNNWCLYCLLNCLFKRRWKKTSKLRVTGLCVGNPLVTGEFPAQRASNAENVSIWWRHHVLHFVATSTATNTREHNPTTCLHLRKMCLNVLKNSCLVILGTIKISVEHLNDSNSVCVISDTTLRLNIHMETGWLPQIWLTPTCGGNISKDRITWWVPDKSGWHIENVIWSYVKRDVASITSKHVRWSSHSVVLAWIFDDDIYSSGHIVCDTYTCVSEVWVSIGSGNDLSPAWH